MEDNSRDMDDTRLYDTSGPPPEFTHGKMSGTADKLAARYQQIVRQQSVSWEMAYRLVSRLGSGGQGVVFLADRSAAFDVNFRIALKFYRPDGYPAIETYREEMARLARVTMQVANIQQDRVLDVYNVVEYEGILVLATEWVNGYDVRKLLMPTTLDEIEKAVPQDRWDYVNDVILTRAAFQSRFQPGVAISILRECLAGISALHREGIIHADLKPANVMIKQTGNCKIIDLGSSFSLEKLPIRPTWTPRYAAVEVLQGASNSRLSDLASLGYVFFELLTGTYPFAGINDRTDLINAKIDLWERFPDALPADVARNDTIVQLIAKMIAPDPADRFQSLEDADISRAGANEVQTQLVKTDLATDGTYELRRLVEELPAGLSASDPSDT